MPIARGSTVVGQGTSGATLIVQDESTTVDNNTNTIDFIGDGVSVSQTEEGSVQVNITTAAINATATGYCPNYPYTYRSANQWRVESFDVTNLFSIGRRLEFVDGSTLKYGTVTAVTLNGSHTDITMNMSSSASLTTTITEVCMTAGVSSWAAISSNPFGGSSINSIKSGVIGSTVYWVACSDTGKLGYSSDKCQNWTMVTTGTTENLNAVGYDPDLQEFMVGGDAGVYLTTDDITTWTLDTTTIPALTTGAGTGNILSLSYNTADEYWVLFFDYNGSLQRRAYTNDTGATMTAVASDTNFNMVYASPEGATNRLWISGSNEDTYYYDSNTDTTSTNYINTSGLNDVSAIAHFYDGSDSRVLVGRLGGGVTMSTGATAYTDDITFSQNINGLAHSPLHDRVVAVADNSEIGYIDSADWESVDSWTLVSNGFEPLESVNAIEWNATDGIFGAVGSLGHICTSNNGAT